MFICHSREIRQTGRLHTQWPNQRRLPPRMYQKGHLLSQPMTTLARCYQSQPMTQNCRWRFCSLQIDVFGGNSQGSGYGMCQFSNTPTAWRHNLSIFAFFMLQGKYSIFLDWIKRKLRPSYLSNQLSSCMSCQSRYARIRYQFSQIDK